jgi:hypothetical protein
VEERKSIVCHKVLDILDENSIDVELGIVLQDEVNGNLGVGITPNLSKTPNFLLFMNHPNNNTQFSSPKLLFVKFLVGSIPLSFKFQLFYSQTHEPN